jgi:predicted deacylase
MDTYPIEIEIPDIRLYADGTDGIPYVHTFDSGLPGPHVMINSITHGNEVCGAIIVKELLDLDIRPERGRLTLAFANVDAFNNFHADTPDDSRFVDQDLNRVWTTEILDDLSLDSSELRRARMMRPVIDTIDFLLDLHSMHERSDPLIIAGPLDKGVSLGREMGAPATIIRDAGHSDGRRLRDYGDFGDPDSPKNATLVECGQHWEASVLSVARDCTARFLRSSGIIDDANIPAGWLQSASGTTRVVSVTDAVVAESMDFEFAAPYTGLETFEAAGEIIGWSNGKPVKTPYPNCVLVMPSLRQLMPGVTVVRLGQLEESVT